MASHHGGHGRLAMVAHRLRIRDRWLPLVVAGLLAAYAWNWIPRSGGTEVWRVRLPSGRGAEIVECFWRRGKPACVFSLNRIGPAWVAMAGQLRQVSPPAPGTLVGFRWLDDVAIFASADRWPAANLRVPFVPITTTRAPETARVRLPAPVAADNIAWRDGRLLAIPAHDATPPGISLPEMYIVECNEGADNLPRLLEAHATDALGYDLPDIVRYTGRRVEVLRGLYPALGASGAWAASIEEGATRSLRPVADVVPEGLRRWIQAEGWYAVAQSRVLLLRKPAGEDATPVSIARDGAFCLFVTPGGAAVCMSLADGWQRAGQDMDSFWSTSPIS